MQYVSHLLTPIGKMLICSQEQFLVGVWFEGQKHFASTLKSGYEEFESDVILATKSWLTSYFEGTFRDFEIPLKLIGTHFQKDVWNILLRIPLGEVVTYGDIASEIALLKGIKKMSPRAVGSAVGKNPISVIVPCHRVIGANQKLTGYAGGLDKKKYLLELEGAIK